MNADKTMSSDSEESFLMNQLNRSELFNSTNNSSSVGAGSGSGSGSGSNISGSRILSHSTDSRAHKSVSIISSSSSSQGGRNMPALASRRSYFRESFIDEDGEDRPFTVFQDNVINESVDSSSSRDVTGISRLNSNILAELDLNRSTSSSVNDQKRRSKENSNSKRSSNRSSLSISQYLDLSSDFSTDDSILAVAVADPAMGSASAVNITSGNQPQQQQLQARDSVASSRYSNSEISARRTTPDFKPKLVSVAQPPQTYLPTPQSLPNTTSMSQMNHIVTPPLPRPHTAMATPHSHSVSGSSSSGSMSPPIGPPPVPKPKAVRYFQTEKLGSLQAADTDSETEGQFKDPNVVLKDVRIPSSSSSQSNTNSNKNANTSFNDTQSIHESVLTFEETRKKYNNKSIHLSSNAMIRPQFIKHDTMSELGHTISIVETPLSMRFPHGVTAAATDSETNERPLTAEEHRALHMSTKYHFQYGLTHAEKDGHSATQQQQHSQHSVSEDNGSNIDMTDYDHIPKSSQFLDPTMILDSEIMEKVRHSRTHHNHSKSQYSNDQVVRFKLLTVFCMAFFIPPLFFLLGFGLLDEFIVNGKSPDSSSTTDDEKMISGGKFVVSSDLKRVGLIVGGVYSIVLLACVGIGFGVGLRNYA